ncbi:hypothetical protein VKS41_001819 [Umbelopsis sp. WA50703]|jgi:hypothetical protein
MQILITEQCHRFITEVYPTSEKSQQGAVWQPVLDRNGQISFDLTEPANTADSSSSSAQVLQLNRYPMSRSRHSFDSSMEPIQESDEE